MLVTAKMSLFPEFDQGKKNSPSPLEVAKAPDIKQKKIVEEKSTIAQVVTKKGKSVKFALVVFIVANTFFLVHEQASFFLLKNYSLW